MQDIYFIDSKIFSYYNEIGDTMTTKKLVSINLILLLLIIFTITATFLFNNYLKLPYDPFNDLREKERLISNPLEEEEIPPIILEKSNNTISEYQSLLEENKIQNVKIAKVYTILNTDGNYHSNYLIVDTKANKIIATIYFRYIADGTLKSLTAEYRYFNDEDFLLYNNSLLNIKSLNISNVDKERIKTTSKKNLSSSWNLGNKYKYEYFKKETESYEYIPIKEYRTFSIFF